MTNQRNVLLISRMFVLSGIEAILGVVFLFSLPTEGYHGGLSYSTGRLVLIAVLGAAGIVCGVIAWRLSRRSSKVIRIIDRLQSRDTTSELYCALGVIVLYLLEMAFFLVDRSHFVISNEFYIRVLPLAGWITVLLVQAVLALLFIQRPRFKSREISLMIISFAGGLVIAIMMFFHPNFEAFGRFESMALAGLINLSSMLTIYYLLSYLNTAAISGKNRAFIVIGLTVVSLFIAQDLIPTEMKLLSLAAYSILAAVFINGWICIYLRWEQVSRNAIIVLLIVGAIQIIFIGFLYCLPAISIPGFSDPLKMIFTAPAINLMWLLSLYTQFGVMWRLKDQSAGAKAHQIGWLLLYLIALGTSLGLMTRFEVRQKDDWTTSKWNVFYIAGDSLSYIQKYNAYAARPPVYPLFIQMVTAGTEFDHTIGDFSIGEPNQDIEAPLMRVAHTQKVFLMIAGLFACAAMMLFTNIPTPALLFLWLYISGYFAYETDWILSETLAQAWLLFLVGVLFLYLRFSKAWMLIAAGALCALLYLTRPAGVFSGIILAAILLAALASNWRQTWKYSLISVVITALMVLAPMINSYVHTGLFTISPMMSYSKLAFALQVAEPDDITLLPDEESQHFFELVLQRKATEDRKVFESTSNEIDQLIDILDRNIYNIALPLCDEFMGHECAAVEVISLFDRVSSPLLRNHIGMYLKIGMKSLQFASSQDASRLAVGKVNFLVHACLMLLVAGWMKNRYGYAGAVLVITHLVHLVIISLFNGPLKRYIASTEIIVVIALILVLLGIIQKWEITRESSKKQLPIL